MKEDIIHQHNYIFIYIIDNKIYKNIDLSKLYYPYIIFTNIEALYNFDNVRSFYSIIGYYNDTNYIHSIQQYSLSYYKTKYDYLIYINPYQKINCINNINNYLNKQNLIFHKKDYTSIYDFGSIIYSKTDAFLERANIASQGEITDQIWLEN